MTMYARAKERTVNGERQRLCNRCGDWCALDKMRKCKGCMRGLANECKRCANARKCRRHPELQRRAA